MVLKAAAAAEARGWWRSQDKTKWYMEQLAANGMKVLPPSRALKVELQRIGEQLTGEWLKKSGADGQAVVDALQEQEHVREANSEWRIGLLSIRYSLFAAKLAGARQVVPPSPLNASAGL